MLTSAMIQQTAHNRQSQKVRIPYQLILSKISAKDYQDLIQWNGFVQHLFRAVMPPFFYNILDQFQACENFQLTLNTKYLSRSYFDQTLILYQDISSQEYLKLLLSCLCLSIKYNQNVAVSNVLTPSFLFTKAEIPFFIDQYHRFQVAILSSIRFRCRVTFPHDYINGFLEAFPWFPNLRIGLMSVIAIPLVFAESCEYTAQEIFFGVVVAIFETKNVRLNEMQKRVLDGMTDCWQNARKISRATLAVIKKYSLAEASN